MFKFGIIGTNWITEQLIAAAHQTKKWQLTSVYSRRITRAKEFGQKYGASQFFDDLDEFFNKGDFDVVYIASPNSCHFEQAMLALKHGKNVIVEKPAFVNPKEYKAIDTYLKKHPTCFLIEAARHIYTNVYQAAAQKVRTLQQLKGASLYTRQYSSRIKPIIEHSNKLPNVFKPEFAGGALMDIGVYAVYVAVSLFGVCQKAIYYPDLYENGIDLGGIAVLIYDHFKVSLNIAKNTSSIAPSEIYGLKELVYFDSILEMNQAGYVDFAGQKHELAKKTVKNPMAEEMMAFSQMFSQKDSDSFEKYWQLAKDVGQVMYELRASCGLKFPADE